MGHVACMGRIRNAHKILVGQPEGKDHLGHLDIDWRTILKWIIKK
jgi:hypothetical protein